MVGVSVIGCGRAGRVHAASFAAEAVGGARLVSVSDPSEPARRLVGGECGVGTLLANWREALDDPAIDAVVVASPTSTHRGVVAAALDAGKHVLCEKPMAVTVRECDEMIAAAASAGRVLQIGFMRRFDEAYLEARRQVEVGLIGPVVQVKSITHGPSVPKAWMLDITVSNGPLAEVNSHDIDTLRWFTASEFEEVYAIAGNYRCPQVRHSHPDFYDTVMLTARFANGMQGFIGGAQGVGYGYDSRCEILGERGLITVGRLRDGRTVTYVTGADNAPITASWRDLFARAYQAEARDFVRCIETGQPPRVTGLDGRMAVQVVCMGNRSILERAPVRIEPARAAVR